MEGLLQQLPRPRLDRRRSLALRQRPEIDMLEPWPNRRDRLHRFAQVFPEDRPQDVVAIANRGDAFLQQLDIEPAYQMRDVDDVIFVPDLIEPAQDMNSL